MVIEFKGAGRVCGVGADWIQELCVAPLRPSGAPDPQGSAFTMSQLACCNSFHISLVIVYVRHKLK